MLSYNEGTGEFSWRNPPTKNLKVGSPAGGLSQWGYLKIGLKGKLYYAHRLAWLYVNGEFPAETIDHINNNKTDNRICNLRAVSNGDNQKNKPIKSQRKGRLPGASYIKGGKRIKRWAASICADGKKICLGIYGTEKEANSAYLKAKTELHVIK